MINLSEEDAGLAVLEKLTSSVKQIQDAVLEEILTCDANTEYLRSFLHGSSDKELFKKNVPVGTYEDFKPYMERVANGESSEIISGKPITGFILTSGTSGGKHKLIPLSNKYLETARFLFDLRYLVLSKHVDDHNEGKGLHLIFLKPASKTPSGLPASYATTHFMKSDYYVKNLPSYWDSSSTSPSEIKFGPDNKQSLYCHLLCGLVQRDEVTRVSANFASILVQGITFLENFWKEMCSNIRSGQLSDWITDSCKDSVSMILGGPNPQLADIIEDICNQKSWKGIIPQLWPKTKFMECIVTGQMAQHVPLLEFYVNDLPLVSPNYASSEAMFGVNLNPLCKPQDVSYTFLPNMSYFEFIPVGEGNDTIVDLVNVKLGCYYELVVTNYAGLHRYRVDDVLQVTGFYNSAPQFKFIRRQNVVLSVYLEATTEEDLLKGVTRASQVLKSSYMMLRDFTCYPHISDAPGHYVLYWELKGNNDDGINELIDTNVLVECCSVVEKSLGALYKRYRSKEGSIGALEIRVVQQGTFDELMEYFISQGASLAQYKTPRCIKSSEALQVLENRVLARFFSEKLP
ncbi:hypothetical protein Bca52824_095082 [Brassica carinata]|uniref:Uncharacterized protein n=1 Tax=Brassica carinata TaxID=52824 RepID=A0A8X7P0V5_BRACI|nr:hypothetical protein Bca52824_095082 [Brassica carinata]